MIHNHRNNPLRHLFAQVCLAFLGIAGCAVASATIEVTIVEGVSDPHPVAIVPFGFSGDGDAPFDLAAVIDADLKRSGLFAPLERSRMLERPTTGGEVDYDDWTAFRAEIVVVGRVIEQEGNDNYKIVFQIMDVPRRRQLLGYSLTSGRRDLRTTAHYISDVIYESIIGDPGVFSTQIAYVSVEDIQSQRFTLVVADADGENQREIVRSDGPIMSPAWSPDGAQMAYVVFEDEGPAIYVQTIATAQRRKVSARRGVNGAPAWSPDGRKLSLTLSDVGGNLDVHVMNLRDETLTRVTSHPGIDTEAVWSPDGESLYFNSDRSGGPQIYRSSWDGGPARRLTFEGRYSARPRVSPDGEKLAVVYNDSGNYRIALVDARRGDVLVVSNGQLDESPSFAPNGRTIIYAAREGRRGVLATVSVDGRIKQRLASQGRDVREPVWGPLRNSGLEAKGRN